MFWDIQTFFENFWRDSWTILRDICVKAYDNNKVYSSIKMPPTEGSVKKNEAIVYEIYLAIQALLLLVLSSMLVIE